MKRKVLFVILLFASFFSCQEDPTPTILSYEFEDVKAFPQTNDCLIQCKNNSVDNVHVFARVLLWAELMPYNTMSFPMTVNQSQMSCQISGLRAGFKYVFTFEIYTSEESYQVPEFYYFNTEL